jgi:hypothetical protein
VIVTSTRFNRALQMVQRCLAECAEDRGDPRTAELKEVIRSCVECINVNRRDHGRQYDARVPQQALRYALGYVDEQSYISASDDWADGRPAG